MASCEFHYYVDRCLDCKLKRKYLVAHSHEHLDDMRVVQFLEDLDLSAEIVFLLGVSKPEFVVGLNGNLPLERC